MQIAPGPADPHGAVWAATPEDPDRKRLRSGLASVTASSPAMTAEVYVYLGDRAFAIVWLVILGLHAFLGLLVLGIANVYWFMAQPEYYPYFTALHISDASLRSSGRAFAVIALLHGLEILWVLFHSLRRRELAFRGIVRGPRFLHEQQQKTSLLATLRATRNPMLWLHVLYDRSTTWISTRIGVHGRHFALAFAIREGLELLVQTYQAYTLSISVPRPWINLLAVLAIWINAASTPVIAILLRKQRTGVQRLACLLVDGFLDFAFSILIPVVIFYPYWKLYDPAQRYFDYEYLMDDVWYVNAVNEMRQVLITTWIDFFSTILPHLNLVSFLSLTRGLVRRKRHLPKGQTPVSAVVPVATKTTIRRRVTLALSKRTWHHSLMLLIHCAVVLWAIGVATVYFVARTKTHTPIAGCKLHIDAWFATNYSCSVLNINCYRRGIGGHGDDIRDVLERLERTAVTSLIISHCPELVIPPTIREFSTVYGIEIYNSSLVDWPRQAAIETGLHDKVSYVFFARSNLSTIPDGLLHSRLPVDFSHLAFFFTNLTRFPDDMDVRWGGHYWVYLAASMSGIRELPPSLGRTSILQLSLVGNELETIDDELFANASFLWLALSDNPLRTLPKTIGDTSGLWYLYLESTKVAETTDWLDDWATRMSRQDETWDGSLHGSPFCDARVNATTRIAPTLLEELCKAKGSELGDYPLDIVVPQRQL